MATLLLLTATAWLRGAEYDEQYTLFLTAGTPRPPWPATVFPAARVAQAQSGLAGLAAIARDLRATDVHPPLYFWTVSLWRRLFGASLFAARCLSVLCGTLSIWLVGHIARRCAIPGLPAMLVTLGCYGFVYTGGVARGFAMAEALALAGTLLTLRREWLRAGVAFGAACACNYLAIFVAVAVLVAGGFEAVTNRAAGKDSPRAGLALAACGIAPFVALDMWFFAAQHGARPGQFPPFALVPAIVRLAGYQAAAVFGGLPLYCNGIARIAIGGLIGVAGFAALVYSRPWRNRPLLPAAALATPAGLLLLGAAFNNTPIELRYLCFGLPFIGLLLARTGFSLVLLLVLMIQSASIAGLLFAPQTMQPARAAAREATGLVGDGVVLVPYGNDGVGIVGAFGIEAPASLPLLLVRPSDTADSILARIGSAHRVVLVQLSQDRDSMAAAPLMRAAVSGPNWRLTAIGSNVAAYERSDPGG